MAANAIQSHLALLTMVEDMLQEVEDLKGRGLFLIIAKGLGRSIVAELQRILTEMRENKLWVFDIPIAEHRYRYSLYGKHEEIEISPDELEFYREAAMDVIEKKVTK
ncbi:hypothetical protein [Cohnella soli]|uniref:Uncharacterized protein n=1 Tax=Cohnella soli TaxID=425005 RepID=A0ABW0HQ44_9BACL